ncbi:hypothetical protein [Maridesulfovibrio sp.]|uniref:hypothetical protein n=1 Tax=Maridesulfovibrio sp. TaxID=2795000 RepID=UPI002A187D7E|nr:hypothetical protein [Maridesulfovibrio sp.]
MHKKIFLALTILLLSTVSTQVQAGDQEISNDITVREEAASENLTAKTRLDKLAKPYDDVKISDGISAGIISEREDKMIENKHGTPDKEKGREVGVGISLSF